MNDLLIKEYIIDRGYRLSYIAKLLDISNACLTNKISGKGQFKIKELKKIIDILNLDNDEIVRIFKEESYKKWI